MEFGYLTADDTDIYYSTGCPIAPHIHNPSLNPRKPKKEERSLSIRMKGAGERVKRQNLSPFPVIGPQTPKQI